MSLCRFSSDNYRCDVYIYESSTGGFAVHVAANRYVSEDPIPELQDDTLLSGDPERILAAFRTQEDWLKKARTERIGLLCDGQSYHEPDAETCLSRVLHLKGLGYTIPDFVIEALQAESLADTQEQEATTK